MKNKKIYSLLVYILLVVMSVGTFMLTNGQGIRHSLAQVVTRPDSISIMGKVRDFRETNADFGSTPSGGFGQHFGIVTEELGNTGRPVFGGDIHRIVDPATNAAGATIAPSMANFARGLTNFEIVDGRVIIHEDFKATVEILGVDIKSGINLVPVTFVITTLGGGSNIQHEPFGSYDDPDSGNVNGVALTPYELPGLYPAGATITVAGKSWQGSNTMLEVDSDANSPQVLVLRNGDSVPDIQPFENQTSLADYISDYVNAATNIVTIAENQVFYLFELGTTNMNSNAADFQDLVVLVSLVTPASSASTTTTGCAPSDDLDAMIDPSASDAGIQSQDSFDMWFKDTLGVNMSRRLALDLQLQPDDTYIFDDTQDPLYSSRGGFFPVDDSGFGNETGSDHNQSFTYQFNASFNYIASDYPYLTVRSNADVWVYLNGVLVIDMGGVHQGELEQRIDLSRLCLTDGDGYEISFFYAQRNMTQSSLYFETNLVLIPSLVPVASLWYYD